MKAASLILTTSPTECYWSIKLWLPAPCVEHAQDKKTVLSQKTEDTEKQKLFSVTNFVGLESWEHMSYCLTKGIVVWTPTSLIVFKQYIDNKHRWCSHTSCINEVMKLKTGTFMDKDKVITLLLTYRRQQSTMYNNYYNVNKSLLRNVILHNISRPHGY